MAGNSSMARSAQILRFVLKHRRTGVFADPEHDAAVLAEAGAAAIAGSVPRDAETGPEAFVRDLEALGPTFVKLGQSLSTRLDMIPPVYLAALERMQDDVQPVSSAVVRATIE